MTTVKLYSYYFNRKDVVSEAIVRVEYALSGVLDNGIFFPYYLSITLKNMNEDERYMADAVFRLRKEDIEGLKCLSKRGGLKRIQQMIDVFSISETQGAARYIQPKEAGWNKESKIPASLNSIPKALQQTLFCSVRHFLRALSTINSVMSDNYLELGEIFSSCLGDLELKVYNDGDLQGAVLAAHMESVYSGKTFPAISVHHKLGTSVFHRAWVRISRFFKGLFDGPKKGIKEFGIGCNN